MMLNNKQTNKKASEVLKYYQNKLKTRNLLDCWGAMYQKGTDDKIPSCMIVTVEMGGMEENILTQESSNNRRTLSFT
jgi:hypothetical protein